MAALHCTCEQKHQIWGEFWWTGGKHNWIFFDDKETSEPTPSGSRTAPRAASVSSARTSRR
jgi:hypothetical protein